MEDAGVGGGGGDGAEGWCSEAAVGLGEGWGVGGVEELGAEFEVGAFGEGCVLDEGDVEVAVGGAADGVAGGGADGESGGGEGGGVEEFRGGALGGIEGRGVE